MSTFLYCIAEIILPEFSPILDTSPEAYVSAKMLVLTSGSLTLFNESLTMILTYFQSKVNRYGIIGNWV